jgi:hypothetical protein
VAAAVMVMVMVMVMAAAVASAAPAADLGQFRGRQFLKLDSCQGQLLRLARQHNGSPYP